MRVRQYEFMRLQSTQGLSECNFDLINFANELVLLRDGYLQLSTDFQMTRSDINSILWHVVHA